MGVVMLRNTHSHADKLAIAAIPYFRAWHQTLQENAALGIQQGQELQYIV